MIPHEVRDFGESDLTDVAQLWHDSWLTTGLATAADPTPEQYRARLRDERSAWRIRVAVTPARIVGFVAYDVASTWLRQLFTHATAQRQGIGASLLNDAKSAMPAGFWLRTNMKNIPARRFYEAQGLRFEGERIHPIFGHPMATYRWP